MREMRRAARAARSDEGGLMGPLPDLRAAFYAAIILTAAIGWAIIEAALWLISNISISWG